MSKTKLLPTTLIVPIATKCINIKKGNVDLGDSVFLKSISQDYIMPIAHRFRVGATLNIDDMRLMSMSSLCLFHEFVAPQVIIERTNVFTKMSERGWKEWLVVMADKKKMIARILRALIFTKAIDLWIKPLLFIQGDMNNPSFLSREYINLYRIKDMPSEIMDDGDMPIVSEIYKRMKKLSVDEASKRKPSKLAQAITFFWVAQTTENIDMAFTAFVTSLEALVLTGRMELKHKFAERVAFFLSGTSEEKIRNHILLSEIYDTRSKVVHGEKHLKGKKDIECLHDLYNVARRCIKKAILNDDLLTLFSLSVTKAQKFEDFFRSLVYGKNN